MYYTIYITKIIELTTVWFYLYFSPQFCAATYLFSFLSARAFFTLENIKTHGTLNNVT